MDPTERETKECATRTQQRQEAKQKSNLWKGRSGSDREGNCTTRTQPGQKAAKDKARPTRRAYAAGASPHLALPKIGSIQLPPCHLPSA